MGAESGDAGYDHYFDYSVKDGTIILSDAPSDTSWSIGDIEVVSYNGMLYTSNTNNYLDVTYSVSRDGSTWYLDGTLKLFDDDGEVIKEYGTKHVAKMVYNN